VLGTRWVSRVASPTTLRTGVGASVARGDPTLQSLKPALFVSLRTYLWPSLALLLALPITVYAVAVSLQWFAAPFPGFLLMNNAVIPTVSGFEWPPDKAALFHGQVIAADGLAVHSSGDVYRYVAARPVGTPITYTIRKDGKILERTLPSRRFSVTDYLQTYGILILFGCTCLAFGLVIGVMRPQSTQARVYLFQGVVAGLYPITAVFLHRPDFPVLTDVYFILECFFPATWMHLALMFPIERRFHGARALLPAGPYLLSALLTILVLDGFHADPPRLAALHATYLYAAVSIVFFAVAMTVAYWENREPATRLRIKAVVPGLVLATALPLFAFVNNAWSGRDFPVQFGLIITPIGYGSIAYAIAKHDLFDIDRIIRQSFVYVLLSLIVIGGYALTLAGAAQLIPALTSDNEAILGMAFALLVAFGLDPLRRLVQNVVDRAFYRSRLDYRGTIGELSEALTTLLDRYEVVAQVTRTVTEAMHLESTSVYLRSDGGLGELWVRDANGPLVERQGEPAFESMAQVFERYPGDFNAGTIDEHVGEVAAREQLRAFLERSRTSIVLPLVFRHRPIGILALGNKRSGNAFGSEDVAVLRTLANQAAIAIENARSYEALQNLTHDLNAKVRQQTRELRASNEQLTHAFDELKSAQAQLVQSEKMASLGQLVAGVAHELNNPASFVHGGLANLAEFLSRFVEVIRAYEGVPIADPAAAQAIEAVRARARLDYLMRETPELLRICAEGSERIKKIVDDLRIFARADRGDRALTEVTDGIESSIRLVGDRLARLGIRLERDYRNHPRIEAQVGQLNQVWMNLLSNAVDAVDGQAQGLIRMAVGAEPDGWVAVRVSDNGHGIAPNDLPKIFEPFFTTKPVGHGTGLGLSIAYGAVKSHGGTIAVDNELGRGTTVTVRLPASSLSH
jgi:signal transduction histidine kinase